MNTDCYFNVPYLPKEHVMILSVATPQSPDYAAACLFERTFFEQTYGLLNALSNDFMVTVSDDDVIVATASYCSGTSNPLLVTEAGAPTMFLQQDGSPIPRHLFVEYGGRAIDGKSISRHNVLLVADILNSAIFRLADLVHVGLVTGIAGPTAPKIFGRIGIHMTREPADRANIERCFPDAWDAFFQAEERSIYGIDVKSQPNSHMMLSTALSKIPSLRYNESVAHHLFI